MAIIASVADFREAARARIPRFLFDYIDGGSYAEVTVKRNVSDFEDVALRQRVMKNVAKRTMKTELFGQNLSMPVGLGPVGFAGLNARRGEVQAARAAEQAGVPFCLSTVSICSVEEVNKAVAAPVWFQLYMIKDRAFMQTLLDRVSAQKCPVLVFTVDLAVAGARYRDVRSGMSETSGFGGQMMRAGQVAQRPGWAFDVGLTGMPHTFGNLAGASAGGTGVGKFAKWISANFDPSVTWRDLDWVRARWRGPIVVKGVLDAEDAQEALKVGVDGVIVSNHGGRQLDGVTSTIKALPKIVEAVDGRVPVVLDGGVRSGLDVLRALALGANACFLGRAWAFALAAGGQAGVAQMLEIIRSELAVAMSLTGCTDLSKAGRELLG